MKSSRRHLLRLVHCLSYLYGKDERDACRIIEHGSNKQFQGISEGLAYDLNMAHHSLYLIQRGDFNPLGRVLWAESQYVHDTASLEQYLYAEQLACGSTADQMLPNVHLSRDQFCHALSKGYVYVNSVRQIAHNLHAPVGLITRAFSRGHVHIVDPVSHLPILHKNLTPRLTLRSYILGLAMSRQRSGRWLAKKLGYSYCTVVTNIKQRSKPAIFSHLRRLPDIFPEVSMKTVKDILNGKHTPQEQLLDRCIHQIHNRQDIPRVVTVAATLQNVQPGDLAKALGKKTNTLQMALLEIKASPLMLVLSQCGHILALPDYLTRELKRAAKHVADRIPLPTVLHFRVNYKCWPNVQDSIELARDHELNALLNQFSNALHKPTNVSRAYQVFKDIIKRLALAYQFDDHQFLQDNFVPVVRGDIVAQIKQSTRTYPVNPQGWHHVISMLIMQLKAIANMSRQEVRESTLADDILLDDDYINQPARLNNRAERLMSKHQHVFTAKFLRTDIKTVKPTDKRHKEYYRPIIVLSDIKDNHRLIMPEATLNYTKRFVQLGQLRKGDHLRLMASIKKTKLGYNLTRTTKAKVTRRVHSRDDTPVPSDIHALTGFAIENNKSGSYDFTTWGHNYGYVRYCKQQYKNWKDAQKVGTENA